MKTMKLKGLLCLTALVLVSVMISLTSCGESREKKASPGETAESAVDEHAGAQLLLQDRCTKCHNLGRVSSSKKSAGEWTDTIDRMMSKGAVLSEDEKSDLIKFVSETYGS